MGAMPMPQKLKILLVLMALSAGLNLLTGHWLLALLGVALAVGVLKGSEGTRVIIMVLAGLGLVGSAVGGLLSLAMLGIIGLFAAGLGVAQHGFTLWCMTSADVQGWMYKRSLPDSVREL
jgi:hypothetical protein